MTDIKLSKTDMVAVLIVGRTESLRLEAKASDDTLKEAEHTLSSYVRKLTRDKLATVMNVGAIFGKEFDIIVSLMCLDDKNTCTVRCYSSISDDSFITDIVVDTPELEAYRLAYKNKWEASKARDRWHDMRTHEKRAYVLKELAKKSDTTLEDVTLETLLALTTR
jgi:hypothetical protein